MLQIVYNATRIVSSAHQPQNARFVLKGFICSLITHVLLVNSNVFNVQIQPHAKYALIVLSISTLLPNYAYWEQDRIVSLTLTFPTAVYAMTNTICQKVPAFQFPNNPK